MKKFFGIMLMGAFMVAGIARAEAPTVQRIDGSAGLFLVSQPVSEILAQVSGDHTLMIERIVTMPTVEIGPRESSSDVCIELYWHGGDVIGSFGIITGRVVSKGVGRGVMFDVVDVQLERTAGSGTWKQCSARGK